MPRGRHACLFSSCYPNFSPLHIVPEQEFMHYFLSWIYSSIVYTHIHIPMCKYLETIANILWSGWDINKRRHSVCACMCMHAVSVSVKPWALQIGGARWIFPDQWLGSGDLLGTSCMLTSLMALLAVCFLLYAPWLPIHLKGLPKGPLWYGAMLPSPWLPGAQLWAGVQADSGLTGKILIG